MLLIIPASSFLGKIPRPPENYSGKSVGREWGGMVVLGTLERREKLLKNPSQMSWEHLLGRMRQRIIAQVLPFVIHFPKHVLYKHVCQRTATGYMHHAKSLCFSVTCETGPVCVWK